MSQGSEEDGKPTRFSMEFVPEVSDGLRKQMECGERQLFTDIDPEYQRYHVQLKSKHRATLVSWIMEVCVEFQLKRSTFHCAINILDRYISLKTTKILMIQDFQLVGITSLWIASKLEEPLPGIALTDFVQCTARSYSAEQLLTTELMLVEALHWDLQVGPTAYDWVCFYLHELSHSTNGKRHDKENAETTPSWMEVAKISPVHLNLIMETVDTSILDMECRRFLPSILAATALYVFTARSKAFSIEAVQQVTKHNISALVASKCMEWFVSFAQIPAMPMTSKLPSRGRHAADMHTIQHFNPNSLRFVKELIQKRGEVPLPSRRHRVQAADHCDAIDKEREGQYKKANIMKAQTTTVDAS